MAGQLVWEHVLPEEKAGKTLLDRMGGVPKLHDFIYGFYDRMLADKSVAPFLTRSQEAQALDVYMKLIKDRTIEYLEQVWGGERWEGQDLFKLHMHLNINPVVYDKCLKCGSAQLSKMSFPSDVKKDIMKELDIMKDPITDADGKFRQWVVQKQKEMEKKNLEDGAVDLHGMGFSCSREMMENMANKAKRKEELKARIAAEKAAREAKEKEARRQRKKAAKDEVAANKSNSATAEVDAKNENVSAPKQAANKTDGKQIPREKTAQRNSRTAIEASAAVEEASTTASAQQSSAEFKVDAESLLWDSIPDLPSEEGCAWLPDSQRTPLLRSL